MRAPARELFQDAAFPASDSSLFSSFSTPLAQFREDITWRRPQEICAAPRLFPDNPQEGQVKQGLLGDCWFLCACAALQKSRHLLDQVIPPGQPGWLDQTYRGSFTCRIWQFGRWVEVTIDDRLPCLTGRLCFSRCQREDVFWLPLLEKAYAKIYGSYEHLWAGQVADALVDLTGGLAERWNLKDLVRTSDRQDRPGGSEHRTCRQLLDLKDRCLISCSVLSPRAGARELGEFHAFIVADLRELRGRAGQSVLLLRIHNPWGRRCWQGPWKEGGPGWSQVDPADATELLSQLQEGEFWVEEEEFLREFDEVTVSYPITEAGHLQSLYSEKVLCHTQELPGAWVKGQSAGGCRNNSGFPSNPKFWLRVSELSEVYVAVLQRPRMRMADWAARARALAGADRAAYSPESFPGKDYQAVGLHIWKCHQGRGQEPRPWGGPAHRGVGDCATSGLLENRPDSGGQQKLRLLPHQPLLPPHGPRGRGPPLRPNHSAPALPGQQVPPHRLPRLPGPGGWWEAGHAVPAAPGASAELRATLLHPGSEPALPPVCGGLLDCALHLPARHRGVLHGDHCHQDRQAVHSQPGDAGAAPPGGLLHGSDENLTGWPRVSALVMGGLRGLLVSTASSHGAASLSAAVAGPELGGCT
uniref:Calpain 10 n=1 Tax=Equus caballus TaxID=9796 RepID=A0A3Q2I3U2_HORSE